MKKTLSILAVLGMAAVIGTSSADAFTWSNLNPTTWFGHNKCGCEKIKPCDPCKKIETPCPTGAAAPCDPCAKKAVPCDPCAKKSPRSMPVQQPCSPCDRLQNMSK